MNYIGWTLLSVWGHPHHHVISDGVSSQFAKLQISPGHDLYTKRTMCMCMYIICSYLTCLMLIKQWTSSRLSVSDIHIRRHFANTCLLYKRTYVTLYVIQSNLHSRLPRCYTLPGFRDQCVQYVILTSLQILYVI